MKILYKLLLITFVLVLGVSLGLFALIYTITNSSLEKVVAEQQLELARQTMDKIDRLLFERGNNIKALAEDKDFEELLALRQSGKPYETKNSNTKLAEWSLLTGPWVNLILVDKNGVIVSSTIKTEINRDIFTETFTRGLWQELLMAKTFHSDVFIDSSFLRPTMVFAAPVINEAQAGQEVVGMVVGYLSWPTVLGVLENSEVRTIEL